DTIIANNTAGNTNPDLIYDNDFDEFEKLDVVSSLIETGADQISGVNENNIFGVDPRLDPDGLKDNGGPTQTIALLPDSPAIDAGDPNFVTPPDTDQRGEPRIFDGNGDGIARIDIGAFESQTASTPPSPPASDNTIAGTNADDTLKGTKQDDLLLGLAGDDRMLGENGDDTFDGGLGQDKYIGGKGADSFILKLGEGLDTIRDFRLWQGDQIVLGSGLTFDDLTIRRFGKDGARLSVNGEDLAIVQSTRFGAINTEAAFTTL
ncbi:MAG: choice-of-anchor Q domain-containing protein, partial [Leptolyngbyaceae cyanobacterium]